MSMIDRPVTVMADVAVNRASHSPTRLEAQRSGQQQRADQHHQQSSHHGELGNREPTMPAWVRSMALPIGTGAREI